MFYQIKIFNRKNIRYMVMCLLIVFTLEAAGCAQKPVTPIVKVAVTNSTYPLKIVDFFKKEVTLDKEPIRVISIAPELTETVFALGKGDKLVGRSDYCDYPEKASKIASVGKLDEPNIEKIVELKPDVVIASNLLKDDVVKQLNSLNIKVIIISGIGNFDGVYDNIVKVGNILNANNQASKLVTSMKTKVETIKGKVKDAKKPSVYYVVGFGQYGDYAAGKNTFIDNIITIAGGTNASNDVDGFAKYGIEKLVEKNPDILICSNKDDSKKGIETTTGYKELKAVKSNNLLEIDDNLVTRQGPRITDGLEAVAKLIHPELFK